MVNLISHFRNGVANLVWGTTPSPITQATQNQHDITSSAQAAHRSSQQILRINPPELQALLELNQACETNDANEIKRKFYKLPENTQKFIYWAIWITDSLEGRPLNRIDHGISRFNEDPMLIASKNAKKVIHINGDSLVEQLLNFTAETLALKEQEKIAAQLPKEHPEQQRLLVLRMAKDLAQYDQMVAVKPFITTNEQWSAFEKYFSPAVRNWMTIPTYTHPQTHTLYASKGTHLYESRGAHHRDGKTDFAVYAPNAQKVQCLLTSFGKIDHAVDMQKQADGTWQATIEHLNPGQQTYLYRVTDAQGNVKDRVDPFSFGNVHVSETDTIHSVVVDRNNFVWNDSAWVEKRANTKPLEQPLSIYEVHIKSWTDGKKNLRDIAPQLAAHCKDLGFTHVELYGIMEHFWGRAARGYQVTNFFAPYHDIASYEDMKYFVNYMHEQGLGVIVDWIPAHYDHGGAHPRHLSSSMHEFDGTNLFGSEKSNWGTLYIDYSKPEAQRLMEASAFWWLKEFHVDGLRFDAVSQLVRRNNQDVPAGIDFLSRLNDKIHASSPGVLTIAEATDWDPRVCKSTKEKGYGFDLNWSVGASHELRNYLRTPENERSKPEHHKGKLERLFHEGVHEKKIATHSHDDMDSGKDNHDNTLYHLGKHHSNEPQRLSDIRNFLAWQIFSPNWGHLLHNGDEYTQPESWYARLQKNKSSMQWESIHQPPFTSQKQFVKDAIHYYKSNDAFWKQGGANSELMSSHDANKVIAYARDKNIVIHNFSNKGYNSYGIPLSSRFKNIAQMQERLNSDAQQYGGSGQYLNDRVTVLHDGNSSKLNLRLPPRSTLVLSTTN
jgi:1,4-alpha-glucan branching enzyme